MKKYFVSALVLAVFAGIVSCGSNNNKENAEQSAPAEDISTNPDYQKGLSLISQNDCLTCHKVSETATGPSYSDIAKKYEATEANINMLAHKIIQGGSGHWGQIPMTPHPALQEADAQQMVKYILLLKNQ